MRYEINGKRKNIPDIDIQKIMRGLQVSQNEAIQIWLEDEGLIINPEQENLNQKAQNSNILRTIHGAISEKVVNKRMAGATEKKKTVKPQPDKEHIINLLRVLFEGHENADNVVVENPTKILTFTYNGAPYKIDLTATRTKKS
jgi:hypothetical protein